MDDGINEGSDYKKVGVRLAADLTSGLSYNREVIVLCLKLDYALCATK